MAGRPLGFAVALVAVFAAAVILGRLVLTGGDALLLAVLGAAIAALLLARMVGVPAALLVAAGMLLTAFLLRGLQEGIATLVTLVGGGLIVSALPAALGQEDSGAQPTPPARY